jgi:hypothetical protein
MSGVVPLTLSATRDETKIRRNAERRWLMR